MNNIGHSLGNFFYNSENADTTSTIFFVDWMPDYPDNTMGSSCVIMCGDTGANHRMRNIFCSYDAYPICMTEELPET